MKQRLVGKGNKRKRMLAAALSALLVINILLTPAGFMAADTMVGSTWNE